MHQICSWFALKLTGPKNLQAHRRTKSHNLWAYLVMIAKLFSTHCIKFYIVSRYTLTLPLIVSAEIFTQLNVTSYTVRTKKCIIIAFCSASCSRLFCSYTECLTWNFVCVFYMDWWSKRCRAYNLCLQPFFSRFKKLHPDYLCCWPKNSKRKWLPLMAWLQALCKNCRQFKSNACKNCTCNHSLIYRWSTTAHVMQTYAR